MFSKFAAIVSQMFKSTFIRPFFLFPLIKILTIGVFISGCEPPNRYLVDIGQTNVNLSVLQLETDLFLAAEDGISVEDVAMLKEKYGAFFELFSSQIIGLGSTDNPSFPVYLEHSPSATTELEIADSVNRVFGGFEIYRLELAEAFDRYHYFFPEKSIPTVYTFISAFSYTIVADSGMLGIGLDKYLGGNCSFYDRLGIPAYKRHQMNPDNLLVDALKSWLYTEYQDDNQQPDLLGQLIYAGKLQVALDALFPEHEATLKFGFTPEQLIWCEENEANIWFHFVDNDLLYKQDRQLFVKYLQDAPFTPGFPEGSPGRVGQWLGWRIVSTYMEKMNSLDVHAMMLADPDDILRKSGYKPKR